MKAPTYIARMKAADCWVTINSPDNTESLDDFLRGMRSKGIPYADIEIYTRSEAVKAAAFERIASPA